ncbi:MAG: DUF3367 domain-containing protein, partial [Aeromicrobium sp.]
MNGTAGDGGWRLRRIATCLVFLAACMLQAPGRIVGDTKIDLAVDPFGFLHRALGLWDASGFAGQVQNQAYGYLFPMGPFFGVGEWLGLSPWIVQRLWWALILSIAFLGANRVAEKLGIGSPASRFLGALVFALSPRILSVMGAVSIEAFPSALAPWVVIPLVGVVGRKKAAALSALAVGLMGGVNATVNLAAILPAVLWLATRRWDKAHAKLVAWWIAFVAVATVWWVVPLGLLGKYSPPFLEYIENAAVTTRTTNLVETLRGTSDWVAFIGPALGSSWQVGNDLVTGPALILNTIIVAAAGLVGLASRNLPHRGWLLSCLATGLLLVTFGHTQSVDGWFALSQQNLLDGVLSPLRNVHKFDSLIRLSLALGVASLLGTVNVRESLARRRLGMLVAAAMVAVSTVLVASPAAISRVAPSGSFAEVPGYWRDTGAWLDANPRGRTLVVPGARFGVYGWGTTGDEVLQALTDSPWEVRNAIPLTSAGHIRMLDAIKRRLVSGRPSAGLSDFLKRNGIGRILVRNDLSDTEQHARELKVRHVLEGSPGLSLDRTFGPELAVPEPFATLYDGGMRSPRHVIEIWDVGDLAPPRVSITPRSQTAEVSGDPQSLLDLTDAGLLTAGVSVLTGNAAEVAPDDRPLGPKILTDSFRRREANYGRADYTQSSTLTAREELRLKRRSPDFYPFAPSGRLATGEWTGVKDVVASSSAADADAAFTIRPDKSVVAAFDGDTGTAWSANPGTVGTTQSITVTPAGPTNLSSVRIEFPRDAGEQLASVNVHIGRRVIAAEHPDSDFTVWSARVDSRSTGPITLEFVPGSGMGVPVTVSEVAIEGLSIDYRVRLARDLFGSPDSIGLFAAAGRSDGCVRNKAEAVRCSRLLKQAGEDDGGLRRRFSLPEGETFSPTAQATARPGPELESLIDKLSPRTTVASVSSSDLDVPLANGRALLDGDESTTWIAAPEDGSPTVVLKLGKPRRLHLLHLELADQRIASRARSVTVTVGQTSRVSNISASGWISLPGTKTDTVKLTFSGLERTTSFDPTTFDNTFVNIGIKEISIDGVEPNTPTSTRSQILPCGSGPAGMIDGEPVTTSVTVTANVLRELLPVE